MTDQSSKPVAKELTGQIGKYQIVKPLGKGAMGMVYLAHDTILERDVALKVMVAQIADDAELNQRFIREAKAVAKMTHPNVVQVFDLGNHTDGSPYIAMELLKGEDLQHAMRRTPPMSLDRKVGIILQVLAGLAHAHQAGIVHRDIKPANIFVNLDGSVKIMDFGVARLTSGSMTGTGNIVGTADYMSPEQVKGAKVDGRSDLFSVGCMLYELCAGKRPFHSDNLMAIFYKITHEEPNFDLIPEGADYDALMPVIRKALAKELGDRYQNAYEFAQDLREYLKLHATSATGEHALEGLVDIEPPPPGGVPQPITDVAGATLVTADDPGVADGTVDLTAAQARTAAPVRPGSSGRTMAPTIQGGRTVSGSAPTQVQGARGTSARGTIAPTVVQGRAAAPAPAPAHSGPPILYMVVGGLAVALVVAGGFIAYQQMKKGPDVTPTTVASLPPTTAAPVTVAPATTLPPPTPAPPPTLAEIVGKGAASVRAAKRAFDAGNYRVAIQEAQAALREDPENRNAQTLIQQAQRGQQANDKLKAAEGALSRRDYATALGEAQAARDLAPWDSDVTDMIGRIQQAQQRAQDELENARRAQAAQQVQGLLRQAEQAVGQAKWDAAVQLYDEVLKVDPGNQAAMVGRTSAIAGRAMAAQQQTAGPAKSAGRSFSVGKTQAQSAETRTAGGAPPGFEDTPGVDVKRGTVAANLPGKVAFDVDPDTPKPGERYKVNVYLSNEGNAPIQITQMVVTTTINGKKVSAPIPPQAKDAAPGQRTLLASIQDTWKEDTSDWGMEVTVRTVRGEKYTNTVAWK